MNKIDYELMVKLRYGDGLIGPGLISLLELSDRTGSMQDACAQMGMAYSKAWKILKEAEKSIGQPLLKRVTGGAGGGSSELTEEGRKLVEGYKAFTAMMDKAADECFGRIFEN